MRSFSFLLKDEVKSGRPYQMLEDKGNYKENYLSVKEFLFPSEYIWGGVNMPSVFR